jgi:hypothetical protein
MIQSTSSFKDLALKQDNQIADLLKPSWSLVFRGIEDNIIDETELAELLSHLDTRSDYIVDELAFEFIGEQLRVKFLDDETYCAPDMIDLLHESAKGCRNGSKDNLTV